MQFLIVLISVFIAVLFMALSFHFSRYKKRKTVCRCEGSEEEKEHSPQSQSCPVCGTGDKGNS
jgi:hypothetical protein